MAPGVEGGGAPQGVRMATELNAALPAPDIRAAGGVVWRVDDTEGLQVLLIHRQRYGDWTFPKGKVDPEDIDDEHTALREVAEEAGLRCTLGRELPSTAYRDGRGRSKQVRYWEMRALSGSFEPNREVDQIRWVTIPTARALLTYPHDRAVLDAFANFAGS